MSPKHLQEVTPVLEFILLGTALCVYDIGMNSIIWFVTFKYWETARQFSRMVRVLNGDANNEGHRQGRISTNTQSNIAEDDTEVRLHKRLYKKHTKYAWYKWIGFSCVLFTQAALAVLITLNRADRLKHEDDNSRHHVYQIMIITLSFSSLLLYIFAMYLLCSSVSLLRQFVRDHAQMGSNE